MMSTHPRVLGQIFIITEPKCEQYTLKAEQPPKTSTAGHITV